MGRAKQGEAVKQTEKQASKFPTKTTVDVCQGGQHLAAQARDHHTKIQRDWSSRKEDIYREQTVSGLKQFWMLLAQCDICCLPVEAGYRG